MEQTTTSTRRSSRGAPHPAEFPLSHGQRALWFLYQLDPSSTAYDVHLGLRILSEVDRACLLRAFERVVARHPALRTTFAARDGVPFQRVAERVAVRLETLDAAGLDAAGFERRVLAETARPFDLVRGPVFRVRLFSRARADHVLVFSAHHIVMDLWSSIILMEDLGVFYAAERQGAEAGLPPLAVGYEDFVRWQSEMLAGAEGAGHWAYWSRALAGELPALELATDRPRPAVQTYRGGGHTFRIAAEAAEALRDLARAERTTLYTTLLAAFQVLLHRYTGQDEILVGTPASGRGRTEFEGVLGYFVNPVVLRADLRGDPPLTGFLRGAHETVLGALDHQDFPFPLLVERLDPRRDPARSPLFQAMFSLDRPQRVEAPGVAAFLLGEPGERAALGGLEVERFPLEPQGAQLDLALQVLDTAGPLTATFEYNSDLFDRDTIVRMVERFQRLLRGIVEAPASRLSGLPLAGPEERRRVLVEWNDTGLARPRAGGLPRLFDAAARADPDAVAVVGEAERVSYAELRRRAGRVAQHLRALELGRGASVGLLARRSADMVAALLGVLGSGAAYVPLDPTHPRERLRCVVQDARIGVLLVQRPLLSRLPDAGAKVLLLEQPGEAGGGDGLELEIAPADVAYVVYTSGSTGAPKGVRVPHRALSSHAVALARALGLVPEDRVLQFHSLAFDVAAEEIFPPLLRGAAVVLPPWDATPSVRDFARFLEDQRVTVVNLPASFWHEWAEQLARDETLLPPDLRLVVTGSEPVLRERARAWCRAARGRVRLCNAYGTAETTITSTLHYVPVEGGPPSGGAALPVGRPVAGTRVYALDARLEPVPVGVPGELCIGGDGVALGYLGRPDLTAERFVPDPFAPGPGALLYRTGDRARWLPHGELEVLGRLDGQIKIRGHRIEPLEVQTALLRHPAVRDAVVVAVEEGEKRRLAAYVVAGAGDQELRAFLRERLPEPLVPAAIVVLERLPRTPGGKVDRRALPPPREPGPGAAGARRVAPRTPVEETLARVWSEVLGLPEVGVHDNFFGLGGDSILSIQVVARAQQAGLRLTTRQMFQHQTIAALAEAAGAAQALHAEQGPVVGEVPLAPIQHWFFEQASPEPHHDNQAVLLELRASVPPERLARAFERLVEHHDALRLRCVREGPGWRQFIAPPGDAVPFARIDLSGCGEPAVVAAAAELQAGLDLGRGPICRAALLDRGAEHPAHLFVVVHHLAVDAVSWRVLLEDLARLCAPDGSGRVELPPKTSSFRSWAGRLGSHARSAALEAEKPYWLDLLATPVPSLPRDGPGHANTESSARTLSVPLSPEETRELLQDAAAAHRGRADELLLAALAWTLRAWTGQPRVLVDVEGHGREEVVEGVDLSRTVGWFTTIHPALFDLTGARAPAEALREVKRRRRSVPNHGIGYGLLRYLAGDPVLAARLAEPRAEVGFNYLGRLDRLLSGDGPFRLPDSPLGAHRSPRAERPWLIEVNALVAADRLRVDWTYAEGLHERATVERLAAGFVDALRALAGHGGRAPVEAADFPLAGLSQRALERVTRGDASIEDLYPLSPLQQGLLFHSLTDATPGSYVGQMSWAFEGDFDPEAFEAAWQELVDRHPVLRTSIVWDGVDEPLQIVRRGVAPRWDRQDWRALPAPERAERLEAYLRADRVRDFDLAAPPLMRLALLHTDEQVRHFVWSHHHLILDGWSLPTLLDELFERYEARRRGESLRLGPAAPYRDFIAWLGRQDTAAAEAFWRGELAGFRAPTPLPYERAAPDEKARDGNAGEPFAARSAKLGVETTAALQALAREHGLTLGTLLTGAWAILLGRTGGVDDVLFGGVFSGRPAELPGSGSMVGLLINTLPVRLRLRPDASVAAWLEEVQRRHAELLPFEHTPLVRVQGWSEVPRGLPLFRSVLVVENYPEGAGVSRDLRGRVRALRSADRTNYPLTVTAAPGPSLALQVAYDRRGFDADAAARLLEQLATLLRAFAARPQTPLARLPLLGPSERRRILVEWSGAARPSRYPERRLHELFAERARRSPEAVAAVCGEVSLTYSELGRRSARLARRLREAGVRRGALVGLCVDRSLALVEGILGILAAGGAYVPLDPGYPRKRLAFMLEDTTARVLVARDALLERLPVHSARVVSLDGADPPDDATLEPGEAAPDDLAYVMYTSGSTGRPKGIAVPHRGVVRLVCDTDYVRLGPEETTLQAAPISFDASTFEIWSSLLHGGRLALLPAATPSLDEIGAALRRHAVTTLWLTAGLFQLMVEERLDDLRGVRQLLAGGDVLSASHVRRVLEAFPGMRVVNGYGPTENTTFTCCHVMTGPAQVRASVPIGRPIAHTQVYVLDERLEPVPAGVEGELFTGGDGLARGYLGRPELTAERFVPDPFRGRPGARLYRTGDRARWLPDGALEFLGRRDLQVKLRGFRVELAEVEAVLGRHEGVKACAAALREDAPGDPRLVAYVVPRAGGLPDAELRAHLARALPDAMIPSAFVRLDRLPLDPNGKVDRRALPRPGPPERSAPAPHAPRTPVEEILAGLWARVLKLDRVGRHDEFFDLGGHSLLATRLVSRIRQAFEVELPLSALFENPSVAALAARIETAKGRGAAVAPPIGRAPRDAPPPLSFAQQRLWFLDQLEPDSAFYNVPAALALSGGLDVARLARALDGVVARHESLRTTFPTVDGAPLQAVQATAPASGLRLEDLAALPATGREAQWVRRAGEEARRPFDLARGPLLRARLFRLGATEHVLLLVLHHIVADGWSMDVLFRELAALYAGRALPALPIQYADFAAWQRTWLQGRTLETQLDYWRRRLEGVPDRLELPTDRPRPQVQSFRGAARSVELGPDLAEALRELGRSEAATLFITLLAAFHALLRRYTGQDDIVVGSPFANRDRAETEGLIGFFVNTLPLRGDLSGSPSFRELLRRVRATVLEAQSHQDLPFERLVDELQLRRDLSRAPLFQAVFTLQNAPREEPELAGITMVARPVETGTAKFDLTLEVGEAPDGLSVAFEYSTDLFDPATIDGMLEHFATLLGSIAADPGRSIDELPLLGEEERRRLLGPGVRASPVEGCLHERFEAQAARSPEAIALACAGTTLSYAELDRRADGLARRLREQGVGPETLVGLCAERSAELVVGILGILKAGGAYLPLDPGYPAERLAWLVEDSRASVIVTHASLLDRLPVRAATIVRLDGEESSAGPAPRAASPVRADNAAYVIHTSGSTGRPKGVVVSHANVARLFDSTRPWFGFEGADVWTLFHSFAFDFSVWEMWGALLHGGRLVVVPQAVSRSPEAFRELLVHERVTVLNQTPSAFRQLVRADAEAGPAGELALRLVVFGGEALDFGSLEPWVERHGDERPRLVNMYGITETTVHVTYRPVTRADVRARRGSSIGRPLPDLEILLLDRHGQPVPAGVAGEIHVGGAGLARGYLHRPDLAAQRFLPHPTAAGARLYRTGDLARRRGDGDLEYLGRVDDQVKIRGFRVELGEIETTLARHPGVAACVARAREDSPGERRLVAYVVPKPGEPHPSAGALRAFLASRLPDHMLPAAFVELDTLPLTPHGKVDHRALPAPSGLRPDTGVEYAPPGGPAERCLTEIWQAILGIERVGVDDNFFALGGDSIRSIQVRAHARERGLELTLQQIFQHQTIRALVDSLGLAGEALHAAPPRSVPLGLVSAQDRARLPADAQDAYPLSKLQAGLVFHSELSPDYIVYVSSFHARGPCDPRLLESALEQLAARHPMLRTSFRLSGASEPLQVVHASARIPVTVEDLRGLDPAGQEQRLEAWLEREMRTRFDWSRAPLLRVHLHRRTDRSFQFTLSEPFLDGWSVACLLTELFERYFALLGGRALPLEPPLACTYRDFVALERETLESEACRRFWDERLDGCVPGRLGGGPEPPARPPASTQPFEVRRVEVEVPRPVAERLGQAARAASVPIKHVLLAAHLKALGHLGGRSDVVTGLLSNGRPEEPDGDRVLGIFLNALPFRLELGSGSWLDLARAAFEAERGMLAFRRFPLAELKRRQGGRDLFDTVFNFTHFHVYRRLHGIRGLEVVEGSGSEQTFFALTAQFNIDEETGELRLALDYRTADLDEPRVRAIGACYRRVLEALSSDPQARHGSVCLLPEAERRRVLGAFNDTARGYPRGLTVHRLFEAQARRTPEAVALVCGGERLSYTELERRAARVARRLRRFGVGPETLVALHAERSPGLVAGMLGILQAGGAYVPLDPAHPPARLGFVLEDTRAPVLLTERRLPPLPGSPAHVVYLDEEEDGEPREEIGRAAAEPGPANLAYVIYTSGSTGRPKGVAIEHRSTLALLHWARETFTPQELSGVLASTSVVFDLSVFEVFAPLCWGGRVILCPSPLHLPELAAAGEVTLLNTVPSVLAELLALGGLPASVRTVNLAGEPLSAELARRVHALGHVERVYNLYGPTEDTTYSTCARVARDDVEAPSLGRPLADERAHVLDAWLQPAPVGVAGEIYLGGAGLARGYLDRPELTAERFVCDPFAAQPGARLYRTGDLGRYRPDGSLEFLGRLDGQVKLRGLRIEPGEIEGVLGGHPAVRSCVAVVREDQPADRRLVAYVVPRPGARPSVAELRGQLERQLPRAMVPSSIVLLERLPRTPGGKLDRRALPAPDPASRSLEAAPVAPATPVEQLLARMWAALLRIERVGRDDDFFALGGHSLLATQLVSRIREALRVELPLAALFEAPRLAALGERVDAALRSGARAAPAIRPVPRRAASPLSYAQQRLWFLDQLQPGSAFYNVPLALRLRGPLDADALEAALAAIVGRQESLRTTFAVEDGVPLQVVHAPGAPALSRLDLGPLPRSAGETRARELAAREVRRPFDLERGPLLRATLVRLAADDHLLSITLHHIVADGWSLGVLLQELAALYAARVAGRPPELAELAIQYADYAQAQREWLAGEALDRQLAYWRGRLAGAAPLELPTDRPRPPSPTFRGARERLALGPELGRGLEALSRREGVTLFMTLVAAFQTLLHRYSGQDDVSIGTPVAGRTQLATERLIGFFVNTLVLRCDLSGDPTFRELLAQVRRVALGAYAHQDVPFERLVEELRPERDLSRQPLFQAMLVLQNAPTLPSEEVAGLDLALEDVEAGTSKFDLTLVLWQEQDALAGALEYSTDLFDATTVSRLAGHFQTLLEGAVAEPERRLSELPLLGEAERELILGGWSPGPALPAGGRCIHERIAEQARRDPAALAAVAPGRRLSYGELERRARGLARRLHGLGVRPGSLVGLVAERSPDTLVGLLGILAAGGAYVPLDPAYPAEWLDFVLADCAALAVVTPRRLADRLPRHRAAVLALEDESEPADARGFEPCPGLDDLAYVIYTSGSTGRPKGVAVTHGSLVHSTLARDVVYPEAPSAFALLPSFAFDSSVAGTFWTLHRGGTLVIPGAWAEDLPRLAALVGEQRVSHWLSVPSLYAALLGECGDSGRLSSLETVIVAGEVCPPELVERHAALVPHARLFNEYGPTEGTVWATVQACAAAHGRGVPIGRPIPGARVYVLDARLQPAPAGVPGELYIGGAGVARGYLRSADLTAERFLPDPFAPEPRGRLYRSRDRARWRPDGSLEFLGRVDGQLKLRGFRIEPGEIEAALGRHPGVGECAVVARRDHAGGAHLAACVARRAGGLVTAGDLREFLREQVPGYMVPQVVDVLDRLPRTPSGKVDRAALEARPRVAERAGPGPVAPRDALERRLAKVFEDVLGLPRVGVEDSFFDLGGHSLLAFGVVARIRKELGRELPLAWVFRAPSVEELAALLRRQGRAAGAPLVPLQSEGQPPAFFCVHPVGGTVLCYAALAERFGRLRPFFGLEAVGLSTIDEMAELYLEAVRRSQPDGPYLLGGWSFGGLVAVEMARRLTAAGHAVSRLVLIDTWAAPRDGLAGLDDEAALRAGIDRELGGSGLGDGPEARSLLETVRTNLAALRRYEPRTYPGRITLLRAPLPPGESVRDPSLGWAELAAGGVEIHEVPGDHYSIMREPHVRALARALRSCIGGGPGADAPPGTSP